MEIQGRGITAQDFPFQFFVSSNNDVERKAYIGLVENVFSNFLGANSSTNEITLNLSPKLRLKLGKVVSSSFNGSNEATVAINSGNLGSIILEFHWVLLPATTSAVETFGFTRESTTSVRVKGNSAAGFSGQTRVIAYMLFESF